VKSLGPQWMAHFLAAGGGDYADIMSFHGYWDQNGDSIADVVLNFKKVFAAHKQGLKPIWDTEANWGPTTELTDPDSQAAFLAKYFLLHWSLGVSRLFWYAYDNEYWGTLWNANGKTKAGRAYDEVRKWMVGATMTDHCAKRYRYIEG